MTEIPDSASVGDRGDELRRATPAFELDESKLRPPQLRPGIVSRDTILEQLENQTGSTVVAVVAPAGYGKTTLLAQWAERRQPRVAWLSADFRDNDPAVLFTYLRDALDRVEALGPALFGPTALARAGTADIIRLAASLASMREPVSLVLDNVETITNPECRDMIAGFALRLPPGSALAIGSRQDVPVPLSRMRAQGAALEVGSRHLAMESAEAQRLLAGAGVVVEDRDVSDLVERTEGWPTGLYLAALAKKAGSSNFGVAETFNRDDRFVQEYLRAEILDRVSRADVSFLVRTSILARLTGPLCDVTVGTTKSARTLDRLERSNLLVVPLDRRGEWYRYHHLFRDLLRAELQRREPEMISELHTRAAAWYEANGYLEEAIEHARQADDAERVSRLLLIVTNPVWVSGRLETVLRWIEWFAAKGELEEHPAIAVHGALIHALSGNSGDAERWATAAQRTQFTGKLADRNTMEGTLAYLRALVCRDGIDEMRRDATAALEGLNPTSPYRAAMLHALGAAQLLAGDHDAADLHFARAVDEATSAGTLPFLALLLTERGLVADEREMRGDADAFARQALSIVNDGQYDDYWTSALVFAWCARVAARRGDPTQARELATRAARLRPLLTYVLPVVSVQALLQLALAYLALADEAGASAALGQAKDLLRHRPDLGNLQQQVADLQSRLDTLKFEMVGASALTTAELRLLPLLATHLTLAEIGERLFISRATVKSQTNSVYRKLAVSSRGEAISRLQLLGLAPNLVDNS